MTDRRAPFVIELDDPADTLRPDTAPPVPDGAPPQGEAPEAAMQRAARIAASTRARKGSSFIGRVFWFAVIALLTTLITTAAYDFVIGLITRNIWLGRSVMVLGAIVLFALLLVILRELAALSRLGRMDRLRQQALEAKSTADRALALKATKGLSQLYTNRRELDWARRQVDDQAKDVLDADALLHLAERNYLKPLDDAAKAVIESAARQVATTTALVPLALADVLTALVVNIRMIRQIAEIYGGRAGTLGSWRLFRAVATHLMATGAVAVGDDLIGSVLGGSAMSRISRRFGEGVINGALTARVGLATIEVCRPLPFDALEKPRTSGIIKRALTGLFSPGKSEP